MEEGEHLRNNRLFLFILIGFVLGILLGAFLPAAAGGIAFLGDVYLNLIRLMVVPILICAVSTGIANLQGRGSTRRIGLKTIGTFIIMFLLCTAISYGVAFLLRPGLNIKLDAAPSWDGELANANIATFFKNIIPSNIFQALYNGDLLPIILFTVLFAIALVACGEKGAPVLKFLNSLSAILFRMLQYIMWFSPIGVMALMANATAQYGMGIFSALGKYILCCYLACIASVLLVMFLPLKLSTGIRGRSFWKAVSKILVMTVSTASSMATLPTTMRVSVDDLGAPEDISNFVLPLGCTINMCGGACSFACLSLFVADFYGVQLPFLTVISMGFVSMLLNMSAPGIPSGGIVLGATFLSIFGLPIDLMGPIAGIYRLLDMMFTSVNAIDDVVANLFVSKSEKRWNATMVKK